MSKSRGAAAALPAAVAWLCMLLTPALAPSPTFAQASTTAAQSFVCNYNRFTNGDFSQLLPGRILDTANGAADHEDIDSAVGWGPLWQQNAQGTASFADLNSETAWGLPIPTPASGNYAAMWIANYGSGGPKYREGMLNALSYAVEARSGTYSLTFKTSAGQPPQVDGVPGVTGVIGIYGVNRAPNADLPVPLDPNNGHNNPSNKLLFGANTTVLLGTVQIPGAGVNQTWMNQTIIFNSANFGPVQRITHIMITKADFADYPSGLSHADQARYVAFDSFCIQKSAPPPPAFSACCPPWTSTQLYTMLSHQLTGVSATPYQIRFTPTAVLHGQMNAYVNYLKSLGIGVTRMDIHFQLANAGTGADPAPAGASLAGTMMQWTGSASPGANFFPTNLRANRWYRVETLSALHGGPGGFLAKDCRNRRVYVRLQVVAGAQAFLQFRFDDGSTVERSVQL